MSYEWSLPSVQHVSLHYSQLSGIYIIVVLQPFSFYALYTVVGRGELGPAASLAGESWDQQP